MTEEEKLKERAEWQHFNETIEKEGKERISLSEYRKLSEKDRQPEEFVKEKPFRQHSQELFDNLELDPMVQEVRKSFGKYVVLNLSRGPTIRGILAGFDPKYRRLIVKQETSNGNQMTFVGLGYVVSLSI